MTRYGLYSMVDNTGVKVITESRNLRTLPFRITKEQLSTGKAWEDWRESIEREFMYIVFPNHRCLRQKRCFKIDG